MRVAPVWWAWFTCVVSACRNIPEGRDTQNVFMLVVYTRCCSNCTTGIIELLQNWLTCVPRTRHWWSRRKQSDTRWLPFIFVPQYSNKNSLCWRDDPCLSFKNYGTRSARFFSIIVSCPSWPGDGFEATLVRRNGDRTYLKSTAIVQDIIPSDVSRVANFVLARVLWLKGI